MTLPTFIGIGAQRAATTWAYECLREHPQIFMARKKEIHFFNTHYDKGLSWYEEYFVGSEGFDAIGEITPNYLNNSDAIPRMALVVPDARIFVILREPVSRAYSAYKLFQDQYSGLSFEQACKHSEYLLRLSCYAADLKKLFDYYAKERVGVYLYEDVRQHPYEMLSDLYSRIGVDPSFKPKSAVEVYNPIILPGLQRFFAKTGVASITASFKSTQFGKWLKKILVQRQHQLTRVMNASQKEKGFDPVGAEYRKELREFFCKDILETQSIIGRDLSSWLKE